MLQCLAEKVEKLEELCSKKEKFLQVCGYFLRTNVWVIISNKYFFHQLKDKVK